MVQPQPITIEEAWALYDSLACTNVEFMIGRWRGASLATKHPLDGVLEAYHWYGKEFIGPDTVYPLLFEGKDERLDNLNPFWFPVTLSFRYSLASYTIVRIAFHALKGVIRTSRSTARIRMMEYRGKVSATMVYDQKPILDVFRLIDQNTVLGVMDAKGMEQPFFFKLFRQSNDAN